MMRLRKSNKMFRAIIALALTSNKLFSIRSDVYSSNSIQYNFSKLAENNFLANQIIVITFATSITSLFL
jgi:hypothetical protein